MPLLLILAFFAAAYLVAPIDPITLRATRGAAGAIGGAIRPAGSAGRSDRRGSRTRSAASPRSGSRTRSGSAKPRRTGSDRAPDPIEGRSAPAGSSRIAGAIRGGIRSADRAEHRRGEAIAAIGDLLDRIRARKQAARDRRQARLIVADEAAAHDENDRRDRAAERDRIRGGVQQIADQIPTTNGEPVPDGYTNWWLHPRAAEEQARAASRANDDMNGYGASEAEKRRRAGLRSKAAKEGTSMPDLTHISLTELDTLDQAWAEASDARRLAHTAYLAVRELDAYLSGFPERYASAGDLYKTGQMNANVALLKECQTAHLEADLSKVGSQLVLFTQAIEKAKGDVKESDAETGRVESARAS